MKYPVASELFKQLPRDQWFNLAEFLHGMYPDMPSYRFGNYLSAELKTISIKARYGGIQKDKKDRKVYWMIDSQEWPI